MTRVAPSLVLLTGGTGFIGFRILLELLQRGYAVRAIVRSIEKGQWLLSRLKAVMGAPDGFQHNLSSAVVDDFSNPNAFDDALCGVCFVIHVAAPIASSDDPEDWERDFKEAVVQSTVGLLGSAKRSRTVQRVVMTSSISAIFPTSVFEEGSEVLLHAEMRNEEMHAPYRYQMLAYQAGKIAALHSTEAWITTEKPGFDVVFLYTAFTIGRNHVIETRQQLTEFSSNWHCLQIILGHSCPRAKPLLTCHIDDVAHCHVTALDPQVPGNQGFLIASHSPDMQWDDAKHFVQQRYPKAVQQQILPNDGHMSTSHVTIDVQKTEAAFGFKHIPYATQVSSLVEQYLELHKQEEGVQQVASL